MPLPPCSWHEFVRRRSLRVAPARLFRVVRRAVPVARRRRQGTATPSSPFLAGACLPVLGARLLQVRPRAVSASGKDGTSDPISRGSQSSPGLPQGANRVRTGRRRAGPAERTRRRQGLLVPVASNPSPCASPLTRRPESTSRGRSLDIYTSADTHVVCFTYRCPDFAARAMNNLPKPCVSISLLFIIMK